MKKNLRNLKKTGNIQRFNVKATTIGYYFMIVYKTCTCTIFWKMYYFLETNVSQKYVSAFYNTEQWDVHWLVHDS